MQKEFTENMSKMYQLATKPLMELAELNSQTFNNLVKNFNSANTFENITHAKKPEEFLSAQTKLISDALLEFTTYSQKAMEIGLNAFSESSKVWTESFSKATNKATEFAKSAANSANNQNRNKE